MKDSPLHCGLLGRHIDYSYSPRIHEEMLGCDAYDLISLEPEELECFLKTTDLAGLNVTTPYKRAVVPCCVELDAEARAAGAVNTLYRGADGWHGSNTDCLGFRVLLAAGGFDLRDKHVLVLGTGGAAAAVTRAVREQQPAWLTICSRDPGALGPDVRAPLLGSEENSATTDFCDYDHLPETVQAVINCTPVGTVPDLDASPLDLSRLPSCETAIDLIYRPDRTRFLLQAKELGMRTANGLTKLTAQAIVSARLFRSGSAGVETVDPAQLAKQAVRMADQLHRMARNIVLVGMPGAGKTSLARQLAKELGRPFADSDREIRQRTGRFPAEILTEDGEAAFRDIEEMVIRDMACREGWVYSTGGGIAERPDNLRRLKQTGYLIHIHKDPASLSTRNRPLSQDPDRLTALFAHRDPLYKNAADVTISNDRSFHKTLSAILRLV